MGRHRMKTKRDGLPIASADTLREMLKVVAYDVAIDEILEWTPDQRDEVQEWAAREYLAASDNPVRRRRMPAFLGGRRMIPVRDQLF